MTRILVSDASPLIALARIDLLNLLQQLFKQTFIPKKVAHECLLDSSLPEVPAIQIAISQKSIKVHPEIELIHPHDLLKTLGEGETAAITLAHKKKAILLIDEKLGRSVARKLQVEVLGTAGLLLLAKRNKLIKKVRPFLAKLQASHYYLSDQLIAEVLRQAKET